MLVGVDVIENLFQQVKSQVAVSAEFMAERPYNTVENDVKVWFVERIQETKIELDKGLEKGKEVGSDFRERVKVGSDEW